MHFIGIGDIHGHPGNLERIPELATAEGVIVSGDLSNHGGRKEAEAILETIKRHTPRVLAQIGNMDTTAASAYLEEARVDLHRKGMELAPGVGVMGVGFSSPTPFDTPSEVPDDTLGKWLEEAYQQVARYPSFLLVSHTPPKDTACDQVGGGAHVGSPAVREFIRNRKPAACLTGHIHESVAEDTLYETRLVNPGMLGSGGYALITVEGGKVDIQLRRIAS
ncbi:metallophosphoesterase family protein [Desulfohalovibrio reitneri]|uniref:metallophosphoesterase family protein n=1 Tax=Desulfohalovibrio reitneri TaxID=1307759 RepID=UPI0004A6BF57|nr:metallophosphoesterase [Desulfohalovibrio reitneri]